MTIDKTRLDRLVSRFLAWPLPNSVASDACATIRDYPHRSGTCLLDADQARVMIEYLFDDAGDPWRDPPDDVISRDDPINWETVGSGTRLMVKKMPGSFEELGGSTCKFVGWEAAMSPPRSMLFVQIAGERAPRLMSVECLTLAPPKGTDLAQPEPERKYVGSIRVVWNPEGYIPRFQHYSTDAARAEARRLAIEVPGARFLVLESIGEFSVEKPVPKWTPHDQTVDPLDAELPF